LDSGALASLTFNGGVELWSGWEEGEVVTINTSMTEANFSNKKMGPSGAQVLAAFMGRKFFQDNGALSKITFDGSGYKSKAVTVETGMTELDCSGSNLYECGAIILAAWIQHK